MKYPFHLLIHAAKTTFPPRFMKLLGLQEQYCDAYSTAKHQQTVEIQGDARSALGLKPGIHEYMGSE